MNLFKIVMLSIIVNKALIAAAVAVAVESKDPRISVAGSVSLHPFTIPIESVGPRDRSKLFSGLHSVIVDGKQLQIKASVIHGGDAPTHCIAIIYCPFSVSEPVSSSYTCGKGNLSINSRVKCSVDNGAQRRLCRLSVSRDKKSIEGVLQNLV